MNVHLEHAYFFESAKCILPIGCDRSGIVHDLLIQLTPDPEVWSIEFLDRVEVGNEFLRVGAIVIDTATHRFLLDFEPIQIVRSTDEYRLFQRAVAGLGLFAVEVTGSQILKEPRFSTSRAVWSHRRIAVPAAMRLVLVGALAEDGPLTLHELCSRVPGPMDPVGAICSLACAGAFEFDLAEGLLPTTVVRCRS